jgi:N-acetylmuramoyl-L-alanine amidase
MSTRNNLQYVLLAVFLCVTTGLCHGKDFVVMLDPGHGGKPERQSKTGGAHWDPDKKEFLSYYRFGAASRNSGRTWTEESLVMWLARKVKKRLELLKSEEGRQEFEKITKRVTGKDIPKDYFSDMQAPVVYLSRDNSYLDHPKKGKPNVNRFFRLFDSPESFDAKSKAAKGTTKGRLSKMLQKTPDLTVCLHINGAATKSARGIHSLFVPHHDHFEKVRKEILGEKVLKDKKWKKVYRCWFKHAASRSRKQWMYNDTWTYFTGYGSSVDGTKLNTATDIGSRQEDLQWKYVSSSRPARVTTVAMDYTGPFWTRERSEHEKYRRAGGRLGYGGDNLYSGDELVKFTKLALWNDYVASKKQKSQSPEKSGKKKQVKFSEKAVSAYLGPGHRPVAADWAVPLFTNSVTAFLELGYITNSKDFWILRNKLDVIADGISVGIVSLRKGIACKKAVPYKEMPLGKPVKWNVYNTSDTTSYFEEIRPST